MALVDLIMPKLGESIMEATILKWHKQVGDVVQLDETVLDIATDKVDSEVPSTAAGKIAEILFGVNEVVPIGAVVARIETFEPESAPAPTPVAIPEPTPTPVPVIVSEFVAPVIETVAASIPKPVDTPLAEVPFVPATEPSPSPVESAGKIGANRFYSPLVINITQREGISMSELEQIPGTGHEYRVTKKDILQYVADKKSGKIAPTVSNAPASIAAIPIASSEPENTAEIFRLPGFESPALELSSEPVLLPGAEMVSVQMPAAPIIVNTPPEPVPAPIIQTVTIDTAPPANIAEPLDTVPTDSGKWSDPSKVVVSGITELVEMDRMRKLIAKHMVNSVQTSPHVTSFTEADVTNMVYWRKRVKDEFEKREGTRITFTPMFIECIVNVMKRYPLINSSVNGEQIIIRKDINIGMATALPTGNLIVPVIKGADQLNIVGLSKMVNRLSDAARSSQLKPDHTTGGTFTFTNVGTFGSLMGTPIINQPQVAILAVGAIKKRAAVIETAEGDTIAVRHMMYLSLSYDHRIIDGSMGASFLSDVAKEMENWDVNKRWYQYL
ncbi:MAG: dihydrolipoamide acetyltransferase family protein [Bacteroidetes bacterium]|nr:dihydrolipoamide acetyltransferase family protein [Bacteroidota bacterium]